MIIGGEGFNTFRGAQQMKIYQKIMIARYYCIKTLSCNYTPKWLRKRWLLIACATDLNKAIKPAEI